MLHDTGAYLPWGIIVPFIAATTFPGPYVVPAYKIESTVALTNRVPTTVVRGAGRPQAVFAMERLMDRVARELKHRPRRTARPQHHPARADALFAGPDFPRRQADGLCQRRFPEEPAPRDRAFEIRQLPRAAGQGPRRGPLSRHRHRQLCRRHRPRPVRGRHHPHHAERQGRGRDRRHDARPGHPHHAVADRRRPSRLPHRGHRDERGRHRHDLAGHRRLRQPPGDQRRLVGDDRRRQCAQAGDRRGLARARHPGERHRRRGRPRHRPHRQQAQLSASASSRAWRRACPASRSRRGNAGARAHRLFHAAAGVLLQRHPCGRA